LKSQRFLFELFINLQRLIELPLPDDATDHLAPHRVYLCLLLGRQTIRHRHVAAFRHAAAHRLEQGIDLRRLGRASPEHRKPLIDARQDGVGHQAEHRAEKGASSEEVRQQPAEMGCQRLGCLGVVPVHCLCRDTGDVPLYSCQQDTDPQEDGANREVDAEGFSALRGAIRNEQARDDEHARGTRKERRAQIDNPEDDNHGSRRQVATFAACPVLRSQAPAAQANTRAAAAVLVDAQRHFGWEGTSSMSSTRPLTLVSWTH
jgi:hypothetical protein